MVHVYGWWDYAPEVPALVNTVTGERLAYCRPATGEEVPEAGQAGTTWLLFAYRHDDLNVPVVVGYLPREAPELKIPPGSMFRWIVDYTQSARLWARSLGTDLASPPNGPPYGLWCRLADCVPDALACWQHMAPAGQGRVCWEVVGLGSWIDGRWSPGGTDWLSVTAFPPYYERALRGWSGWRIGGGRPAPRPDLGAADVPLARLDMPPPARWRFHDVPPGPDGKPPDLPRASCVPGLRGVQRVPGCRKEIWDHLPVDAPLRDATGVVPHQRTEDDTAILLPKYGDTEIGKYRAYPSLTFDFANTDCYLRLSVETPDEPINRPWYFRFSSWTERSRAVDDHIAGKDILEAPEKHHGRPTPAVWRNVVRPICDAFITWPGSSARHSGWFKSLTLRGGGRAALIHRPIFIGGQLWQGARLTRSDPAPQEPSSQSATQTRSEP